MKTLKLPSSLTMFIFCYSILITTIINHSTSLARTIADPTPPPTYSHHHHHLHKNLTFLMQNILNATHHAATTKLTSQIPFPKPLGFFPPSTGILIPQPSNVPTVSAAAGFTMQALDDSTIGLLSFPARATLEELEYGSVAEINEELFENTSYGPVVVGRAQGVFVASSEDGFSHMVAMAANFNGDGGDQKGINGDGLRFFGVHSKKDKGESHIAVIGGTGKYEGANGFAVMEVVDLGSNFALVEEYRTNEFLLFSVYLG
ncbi:unnamed protein product [Linum tenue]|uniref:Dirigent protein n=1 Tax=Linum tenue TaxID=586396 RepID=A0AAV0JRH8_9ROSI|nr:unnamed protein product [Linum tenue]